MSEERSRDLTYNPNDEILRRWTYSVDGGSMRSFIIEYLNSKKINPSTHPKVMDLCSGDGSLAAILIENGWNPSNITCVDLFKSPSPLIYGVNWKYLNISHDLVLKVRNGQGVKKEFSLLEHSFDLVTLFQGYERSDIEQEACEYFVKSSGFIYCP